MAYNLKTPKTFEKSFASHPKAQYWSSKNTISPSIVSKSNGNNFWFDCTNCNHDFEQKLNAITNKNRWCIYCCGPDGNGQKLCGDIKCEICFKKSFAYIIDDIPQKISWSPNNTVTPQQIHAKSRSVCLFICNNPECLHEFTIKIIDISRDRSCSYCASKKICDNENCVSCFKRSFASHEKSKYLSNKNINPKKIFYSATDNYDFDCDVCGHTFNSKINNITSASDSWCPYCSKPTKKICNDESCLFCLKKSFKSHAKSQFWSSKNNIDPRFVIRCSNTKYLFNCRDCGNEILQKPNAIINKKRWCSICVNKTEKKLYQYLITNFPLTIKEFRQEWCKNIRCLPFDFCIPNLNIIIELDGKQHFIQVSNWKSPDEQLKTDIFKMKKANQNNYSVIRIIQEDVLKDTYNWQSRLCENINKIQTENIVQNLFISTSDEYEILPSLLQLDIDFENITLDDEDEEDDDKS